MNYAYNFDFNKFYFNFLRYQNFHFVQPILFVIEEFTNDTGLNISILVSNIRATKHKM